MLPVCWTTLLKHNEKRPNSSWCVLREELRQDCGGGQKHFHLRSCFFTCADWASRPVWTTSLIVFATDGTLYISEYKLSVCLFKDTFKTPEADASSFQSNPWTSEWLHGRNCPVPVWFPSGFQCCWEQWDGMLWTLTNLSQRLFFSIYQCLRRHYACILLHFLIAFCSTADDSFGLMLLISKIPYMIYDEQLGCLAVISHPCHHIFSMCSDVLF